MKKCPYCAEEIQDGAIVCRYCGRDLPTASPPTEIEQDAAKPAQDAASKQGAKAAAVITVLYVVSVLTGANGIPRNRPELIGDLTVGLAATFIGWWLICTFIVWAWRKLPGGTSEKIGMAILVIGAIFMLAYFTFNGNTSAPTPTPARVPTHAPTIRPTKTPLPTQPTAFTNSNCTLWTDLRQNNIGETMCVQGLVKSLTGNTVNSGITRIYFKSNLPEGYVWADGTPAIFYFVDDTFYYNDIKIDDCVAAEGLISVNEDGILFMRIEDNLRNC